MDLKRKIAELESLLERAVQRYEKSFGKSKHCIMGNDYEHNRWDRVKLDEPALVDQDRAGRSLLPTWDELTADLYSGLRRTGTVLFEENQIAPTHHGNRKLLAPIVQGEDFERIHDLTMGDDNMCVIAALRIQDGLIEELKRQKDEADRRRQEQEERAQQRRQEREEQKEQEEEDGEPGESDEGSEPDGSGAEEDSGEGGYSDSEGKAPQQSVERGAGEGEEATDEAGESGSEGSNGQGNSQADVAPEPNNAVEAAEAGAAAASAAKSEVLSLQAALREAQRLSEEGDTEEANAAADAALEAAQALAEATEEAEERLLAQEAYDELVGDQSGEALDKAITFAAADLKDQNEKLRAWGVGQGDLKEMSPKEVMELVKGLRTNPDLKAIAELVGQQRRSRLQRKERVRYDRGPTVRYGVETGRRLDHMLGSQKLLLSSSPSVFAHRYVNNQIQQFKTRIEEVQERGTGVIWIDASGSMYWGGSPYTYNQVARATAISLVEYFYEEGRDCVVGIFDHGVRDIIEIPKQITRGDLLRAKLAISTRGYGGGTDFFAPLVAGFRIIEQREYLESADQVLITDGDCYLSPQQVEQIKKLQEESKVNIITMVMPGGSAEQLRQFGPVDRVGTTSAAAVGLADKIVSTVDAGYEE